MSKLTHAREHLTEAVAALEEAKRELPDYAIEAVILARAELKVSCRRPENLAKAVGDTGVVS